MGLVDDAVPHDILLDVAVKRAKAGWLDRPVLPWQERLLSGPLGKALLFKIVGKNVGKDLGAITRLLNALLMWCVKGWINGGPSGYEAEARAFGDSAMSLNRLLCVVCLCRNITEKRDRWCCTASCYSSCRGLGWRPYGRWDCQCHCHRAGLPVRIKDINPQGINRALKYTWDALGKRVRSKRMRPAERQRQMMLISGSTDYCGFDTLDIVVEAVFEDLSDEAADGC